MDSEMEMSSDQLAASDAVEHLRENVRLNLQITRNERRHQKVDSIRIGIGEFSKTFADVQTFSEDDVLALANRIKQQKHAKSDNLIQLSHAFLQSSENIQCFLKVTGALNVLVKELTGHDTNTQMLAAEVMCNLSLGSEVSSEKVALCAASYLITFLKSPNEWLVSTSLWTLTNLLAAGEKPWNVLMSQEIIKCLINVFCHSTTTEIQRDACNAIEVAIDGSNHGDLKSKDCAAILEWVSSQEAPLDFNIVKIAYKFLNSVKYQVEKRSDLYPILRLCFRTLLSLCDLEKSGCSQRDVSKEIIILGRIIGNTVAKACESADSGFLEDTEWKLLRNPALYNRLFECVCDDDGFTREIHWFVGVLLDKKLIPVEIVAGINDNYLIHPMHIPMIGS